MSSMTNGICGTEGLQLAERLDIQPFQGWGFGMTPTQGGASLTLGFDMEPRWGSRSKPRHNPEMNGWPHINGHAGDADVVSTVRSAGNGIAFVGRPEVVGWAP